MEFVLFEKLSEVSAWEWVLFGACILLATAVVLYLILRPKRDRKKMSTQTLVEAGLCMAISFVLSYIKLFSMPMGGSVTLGSMLPLMYFSYRHSWKSGLLAGLAYGLLQFIQKPEIVHWAQMLLDYPLAFTVIGLAGLSKQLQLGCLIGGLGRFVCHFLTGALFFSEYMPSEWSNVWLYSFCYNGLYMGAEIVICILLSIPLYVIMKRAKLGRINDENRPI